jgi:hypothetical protein
MPPHYTIIAARPEDLAQLPAIELAAARLLEGHAPESVLGETTSADVLENARRDGRLWVAPPRPLEHAVLRTTRIRNRPASADLPRAIVADETRRGLDPSRRVVMRRSHANS